MKVYVLTETLLYEHTKVLSVHRTLDAAQQDQPVWEQEDPAVQMWSTPMLTSGVDEYFWQVTEFEL